MGIERKLNVQALPDSKKENLITAVYVGFIFILLAALYFINVHTNLWGNFVNFLSTFILATVPGTSVSLPAPANPAAYTTLYNVGFQFCLGVGLLEIAVLALRIWLNSPLPRKAETIENIVFWLGTSYLAVTYLVNITIISEWFVFWAGVILIVGLSLVARAFVLMASR
jgi:signal transduction histidine kinase